jgi:hypothetical protein
MSFRVLTNFWFPHGIRVELLGDEDEGRLTCRIGIPGGGIVGAYEESLPLGNARDFHQQLGLWLGWHETCHRCEHPRREHFDWWAADARMAGCIHGAKTTKDGYVVHRAFLETPCTCPGIDRLGKL